MILTDKVDKIMPKYKAWSFLTFPVGIGLKQVLLIKASKSDSYHILSVPAAPEPIATARREIQAEVKSTLFGAINKPTIQVNKTKDITLGFIKLKNDSKLYIEVNKDYVIELYIKINNEITHVCLVGCWCASVGVVFGFWVGFWWLFMFGTHFARSSYRTYRSNR